MPLTIYFNIVMLKCATLAKDFHFFTTDIFNVVISDCPVLCQGHRATQLAEISMIASAGVVEVRLLIYDSRTGETALVLRLSYAEFSVVLSLLLQTWKWL